MKDQIKIVFVYKNNLGEVLNKLKSKGFHATCLTHFIPNYRINYKKKQKQKKRAKKKKKKKKINWFNWKNF